MRRLLEVLESRRSAGERVVDRETGNRLAGRQILRQQHAASAAPDRDGEDQGIPESYARPILDLECRREVRGRDAVYAPRGVGLQTLRPSCRARGFFSLRAALT